jgi:hypothetical protein
MDKIIQAFTNVEDSGYNIELKDEDIALFCIIPFGDFFLRVGKLNGSLDKGWTLVSSLGSIWFISRLVSIGSYNYTLMLIISYIVMGLCNVIPTMLVKKKLIKKRVGTPVIDWFVVIPVIVRFCIIIGLAFITYDTTFVVLRQFIINGGLFLVLMFTNFMRLLFRKQCNPGNNTDEGKRVLKIFIDSILQYGIIFVIMGIGASGQGGSYQLYTTPVPIFGTVGEVIDTLTWCFGAIAGYMLVNMFDENFNTSTNEQDGYPDDDTCRGNISILRYVVSSIIFLLGLIFYLYTNRFNAMYEAY